MLDNQSTNADVALLTTTTSRPSFTIQTEEVQVGALPGRIALRYLGVPAFSNRAGLSGGAIVTSYAARTHPLHAPSVLSDVRVGRYVRDNVTGEWCIITRNQTDRVTRLQYVAVKDAISRERICLTCSSDLFDAGNFLASVLFQCHDREWRVCPTCSPISPARCACISAAALCRAPPARHTGLRAAAASVLSEGPASWVGTVQVTVCSNLSKSTLLDIDECMGVTSSYQPAMDTALAADMQRLAIIEKVASGSRVPSPLADPPLPQEPSPTSECTEVQAMPVLANGAGDYELVPDDVVQPLGIVDESISESFSSTNSDGLSTPATEDPFASAFSPEAELDEMPFVPEPRYDFANFFESAMMPADPSTLPGGIELCMDGMEIEDEWNSAPASAPERQVPDPFSPISDPSVVTDERVVLPPQVSAPGSLYLSPPLPEEQTPMQTVPIEPTPQPVRVLQQPFSVVNAPTIVPKEEDELHVEAKDIELKPQPISRGRPLAPRPAGIGACADGFIWQMGAATSANAFAMATRLEALEKERKAEERRKKNRQAAARSNARKKCIMDGIKSQIREARTKATELRKVELALQAENLDLKRKVGMSD